MTETHGPLSFPLLPIYLRRKAAPRSLCSMVLSTITSTPRATALGITKTTDRCLSPLVSLASLERSVLRTGFSLRPSSSTNSAFRTRTARAFVDGKRNLHATSPPRRPPDAIDENAAPAARPQLPELAGSEAQESWREEGCACRQRAAEWTTYASCCRCP